MPNIKLPKKEAKWQTVLNKYFREERMYCYYELKQTYGKTPLPFSSVKQHQINGLKAAQNEGFVWKLSDQDQRQKPFDGFSAPSLPAYVIIKYDKAFVFISLGKFEEENGMSEQRSLTWDRACEIADKLVFV